MRIVPAIPHQLKPNVLIGIVALVVAVSPDFEGKGIGKKLLHSVVKSLQSRGCARLWLAASPDPGVRSHGFYRHLGWQPTGQTDANGDEILECTPNQRLERPVKPNRGAP